MSVVSVSGRLWAIISGAVKFWPRVGSFVQYVEDVPLGEIQHARCTQKQSRTNLSA